MTRPTSSTMPIDDLLALENPEVVVLDLLQHTAAAAYQALVLVHPEITAQGNLGPLADECHAAMLLADTLDALSPMLAQYRAAIELSMLDDDDLDTTNIPPDIPF